MASFNYYAPADLFPGSRPPGMHGADIVLAELDRRGESLRQLHVSLPLKSAADFSVEQPNDRLPDAKAATTRHPLWSHRTGQFS